MKRILLIVFSIAILGGISSLMLSSCNDDTDCGVLVVARDAVDTNIVIGNASVVVGQKGASINQSGRTDGRGEFFCSFKNPAILNASVEVSENYKGVSSIRLKSGETVRVLVRVKNVD